MKRECGVCIAYVKVEISRWMLNVRVNHIHITLYCTVICNRILHGQKSFVEVVMSVCTSNHARLIGTVNCKRGDGCVT